MTLIFTNPLFTMIFAAIFLGHRLTCIKNISALILFAGIILVTKPPFLFPEPAANATIPTNLTLHEAVFTQNPMLLDKKVLDAHKSFHVFFLENMSYVSKVRHVFLVIGQKCVSDIFADNKIR